jgi:hypothetical protein
MILPLLRLNIAFTDLEFNSRVGVVRLLGTPIAYHCGVFGAQTTMPVTRA